MIMNSTTFFRKDEEVKREYSVIKCEIIKYTLLHAKKIADRINRLRLQYGYTVNRLALRIGVSPSYISRILNGERAASIEVIAAVAEVFNLPLDYLVYGKTRKQDFNQIYLTIASTLEELSGEQRLKLISLLSNG